MIQKILTSLRYGNIKTKRLIISIIFFLILAMACTITAIGLKSILWGLGAVFSIVLAVIIMTSVSFKSNGRLTPVKENLNKQSAIKIDNEEQEKLNINNNEKNDNIDDKDNYDERDYITKLKQSDFKKILVANKVKKEHMPVMIDSSISYRIRQCPAYIWTTRSSFYILLLEERPRKIKIPLSKLNMITYKPGVTARRLLDYQEFQKPSFASLTFGSLLPVYYEENNKGRIIYKKNLYVLEPDIIFTSASIKAVMKQLKLDVTLNDRIMQSDKYSSYFKEGYKINLLWKDGVYNTKEFKAKIRAMLQSMAEADISTYSFNEAVMQLIEGRLVTKEYAEYYIEYRKKNEHKKVKHK